MLQKSHFTLLALAMMAVSTAQAVPSASHQVVAPSCLIQAAGISYKTLASNPSLSLIEVNDAAIDPLAEAKHHSKKPCGGFMDVTRDWAAYQVKPQTGKHSAENFLARVSAPGVSFAHAKSTPYTIQYEKETNALLGQIVPQNMWDSLTTLSSFKDRYSNSDNGVAAANWLKNQVETIAKATGHDDVTVYLVSTGRGYKQPSVVAKVGNGTGPGIVVGGHMDTLSSRLENKPGADDDGTGTVTVLETARTVLSSGMHFNKPIYFVWYAAEEMGLVGSDFVVADFQEKKIPVDAVIQLDMTGYAYKNQLTMWLMTDYVNKNLTNYLETLINTYVKRPVKRSQCGYACSDHASWNRAGIPSSIAFETEMGSDDPYIHTSQDTMEKLSLTHMTDYVKLATAFTVELAEPTK